MTLTDLKFNIKIGNIILTIIFTLIVVKYQTCRQMNILSIHTEKHI